MEYEKTRPFDENEEKFDDVVNVKSDYEWMNKYKPKKP